MVQDGVDFSVNYWTLSHKITCSFKVSWFRIDSHPLEDTSPAK